ncbi:MAG: fibronectin type III domain-containing protein, partial [Bacteroidaceae bacterium]|nr:fibronectin type III domain-containing protein [Bacteroidaceae bacterium]
VFDAHTRINIYGTSVRNWLVSPSVEVAANYVFDFDLALTRYSGTLQPVIDTLQQDDRFVVLISTDNMESWTILRQWDNAGSEYVYNNITCSATGEHVSFDLSAYVGQNVRIAFYGESTVAGGDNNLHIDNVVVGIPIPAGEWMTATTDAATCILTGLIPETDYEVYIESVCEGETSHVTDHITITTDVACPAPTGLSVANITPTSADLSWTTSADAWEIEVADDQTPPVVTTWIADTNPFTVPDLNPETEYTVRVRANCDGEGYSEWSASATFTTLIACPVPFDVEVDTVTYNSATVAWTGFSDSYILNWAYGEIHPLINVNFEDQTIPANWTNTATADTLVWTVVTDTIHNSYCMISGNAGVASSTSEVSCVMTYPNDGTIEFDAQCMGEGTSWDVCRFLIDDDIKLAKGANGIQWDHYSFAVTAGEHTFTWIYSKDSSVNGKGDHFAVDNIKMYYENLIRQDPITAENTPYTFTGLTPETNYYVTVQGVCGDEQAEPSGLISFKTADYDWTGCGLENDPYIITTTEELGMLALCVNSGNGFSGKFFKQVADIDMSGIAFTSIGNSDNPFSGTFDGQGYTVSGISIDKSDGSCLGLFGHINNGAVKNVTLANSSISGSDYVGGIVGCIDGGTVMNSLVIGAAVSGENNTGAVVGSNSGNLSYNYYSGCTVTVNGTVNDAGVGCGNPSGDITDDDGALAATVLSESSAVPSDLSGKVVFRRMFTGSSASTVCLPFEYTPADGVGGFYTFAGIEKDHDTWVATMMETGAGNNMVNGALMANIPYLFMPAGTDSIVPVLFHGPAASEISAGTATDGDWKFTGTYTRLTYGTEPMVGYIYGFASKSRTYDGQNVEAGEFVQAMDGASVPPMRCYLIYKEGEEMPYNVFIRDEAGRDWELPARITVRLVSAEGNVTAVGSIDTSTGDVTIDTWYDMSGRPINGIPTSPGLYINNGEKIRLNGRIYD